MAICRMHKRYRISENKENITFHRITWWSPDPLRDPLEIMQSYPHLGSSSATTI